MEIIDQLKSKYKLSAETEKFLQSHVNGSAPTANGHREGKEGEEDDQDFASKIAADFDGSLQQYSVPSASRTGGIPITVILPKDRARRPGIIVYFHAGTDSFGSCSGSQPVCMLLARELKCVIVNVDYRQGADDKFPTMFDDGKVVVRWAIMNKSLLGGENDSKIGVCGSCLGGTIAATVAFETPGIDFQILIYPIVDMSCERPSWEEFNLEAIPSYNPSAILKKSIENVVRTDRDRTHVRVSPLLRPNFANLPPTLLLIAEVDPLKDANYEFKAKLKDANVYADSKLLKGSVHGFISLIELFPEINGRTREIIAQFYKKHGVC